MLGRSPHTAAQSWRNFLSGLTAALLLLPVPAYATITWATPWNVNMGTIGGTSWTQTNSGTTNDPSEWLFITAKNSPAGGASGTITISSKVTQLGHTGADSITPNISGLNNLTMTAGTVIWQVKINNVSQYTSGNQFSAPSSGPPATQTGVGVNLPANTGGNKNFNVSATFNFSSASTWTAGTVSSSSFTFFFNGT